MFYSTSAGFWTSKSTALMWFLNRRKVFHRCCKTTWTKPAWRRRAKISQFPHLSVTPRVSTILSGYSECSAVPSPGIPREQAQALSFQEHWVVRLLPQPSLSLWFQGIHQAPAFLPWGISQVTGTQLTPVWNSPSFNTLTTTKLCRE